MAEKELLKAAKRIQEECRFHTAREGKNSFFRCGSCIFQRKDKSCMFSNGNGYFGEPLVWRIDNA